MKTEGQPQMNNWVGRAFLGCILSRGLLFTTHAGSASHTAVPKPETSTYSGYAHFIEGSLVGNALNFWLEGRPVTHAIFYFTVCKVTAHIWGKMAPQKFDLAG